MGLQYEADFQNLTPLGKDVQWVFFFNIQQPFLTVSAVWCKGRLLADSEQLFTETISTVATLKK